MTLTFHLAGINNQNFLMRDEETGSYWQQITGSAISGPLAGRVLKRIPADQLGFALWKREQPAGTVLRDAPAYASNYVKKDWDVRMAKQPTVLSYRQPGIAPRELMLGIAESGAARAFPYDALLREKLILDRVGSQPVLLVLAADGRSVRAFRAPSSGFYRQPEGDSLMMDEATGSRW